MKLLARYRAYAQREADTRYVDVLDGVRALAIFIVAWYHIWQQSWLSPYLVIKSTGQVLLNFEPLVRSGYIMVDVMLLLSGFLLFLPYARRMAEGGGGRFSIKEFYLKRALRILPSYWLSIFVILFFFALPSRLPHNSYFNALGKFDAGYMWKDLLSHLSFTHVFWIETYHGTRLNVVLWTLAIEVQFYLIFPAVARLFEKWPGWTWLGMTAGAFAFRLFVLRPMPYTNLYVNQLPAMLDVYANGMLAACCYVYLAKTVKGTRWSRVFFSAVALLALMLIWRTAEIHASSGTTAAWRAHSRATWDELIRINQADHRFMFSVYAAVFIVAAANACAGLRWLLSNRLMRFLSAISFQFYIWHQYLADQMHNRWRFPPSASLEPHVDGEQPWQWLFTLCAFGFPLVLAVALTYGFERPIARAGLRAWGKRKERMEQKNAKGGEDVV